MQKRGIYYFRRSVPVDLAHYFEKERIIVSLRTKDQRIAKARAKQLSMKLQQEFDHLRWRDAPDTFSRYIAAIQTPMGQSDAPTLTEATELYASVKGKRKPKTFHQSLQRAVRYLASACGNKPIDTYSREDANTYRDSLFRKGLSGTSVSKSISVVRAMLNFVCRENGLELVTAFSGVHVEGEAAVEKRVPVPIDDLRKVQRECRQVDDEARWVIALISDTGMRLSEALGLSVDDVVLTSEVPHIRVREHKWRRLKTSSSTRLIPLVGAALWAAGRAVDNTSTDRLFPRYCSGSDTKSNSASATLNKWLSSRIPKGAVVHSFRHSIRDRLRNVECPREVADAIGGWTRIGIGEQYGSGYSLSVLSKYMFKIVDEEN